MSTTQQPDRTGPAAVTPFPPGIFRPDPRRAKPLSTVRAASLLELKMVLRNGEQLLLALVIPLAVLLGANAMTALTIPTPRIASVVPSVFALAVMSTAFTSQAITTGFDRRYGVLKRLAAAGVGRSLLIAGKCGASVAVIAGQLVILGTVGVALGWRPHGDPLAALLLVVLGAAAFIGLALLVGGTLRAEAVLALANLLWLLMVLVGGVVVPLDQSPGWLRIVGELTPAGALSAGLHHVLRDGAGPGLLSVAVLAGWILIGWAGTVRWFKWQ